MNVVYRKDTGMIFQRFTVASCLLWAAFLSDAFIWQDILGGLDMRGVYVIIICAIAVSSISGKLVLPKELIFIAVALLVWSIVPMIVYLEVAKGVVTQLLGAMGVGFLAYYLLSAVGGLERAAKIYLRIAQALAGFVIIDQVLYLIGGLELVRMVFGMVPARTFDGYVTHGVYRASGLLYEPSQVGLLISPAVLIWLYLRRSWSATFGSIAIISSFSTLGVVGLAFALVLSRRNPIKTVVFGVVLLILILSASFLPILGDRIGGLIDLGHSAISGDQLNAEALSAKGGTVATLGANAGIAFFGAREAPVFGWGLGSFRVYYNRFLEELLPGASELTGFYNPGGGGLLLRMLFELGFVGVLVVACIYWWRVSVAARSGLMRDKWRLVWVLASGSFFMLCLLRKDMFVSFYFWFFLMAFVMATRRSPGAFINR